MAHHGAPAQCNRRPGPTIGAGADWTPGASAVPPRHQGSVAPVATPSQPRCSTGCYVRARISRRREPDPELPQWAGGNDERGCGCALPRARSQTSSAVGGQPQNAAGVRPNVHSTAVMCSYLEGLEHSMRCGAGEGPALARQASSTAFHSTSSKLGHGRRLASAAGSLPSFDQVLQGTQAR
jgi:hypothetical protein